MSSSTSLNTSGNLGAAIITGASTGIGAVYAERLAARGYDLVLIARDKNRLEDLAKTLINKTGRKVEVFAADLLNKQDLNRVEKRLHDDKTISLLVNNAGLGATASLIEADIDQLENLITLNVTVLTRLAAAAAKNFIQQQTGAIINIASVVALAPELLNGVYSGSKAFVVNLTQSMHHELKDKGIHVQAVLPGAIATPFWAKSGLPVEHLPSEIVMTPEDLVDAALAAFDQNELITIPSLPDANDWENLQKARIALAPNLSHQKPAQRYFN